MRSALAYLTALAFLLAPVLAWADPVDVPLHYIPIGERLVCGGEEFQCYTFDEWKTLLSVDADLYATKNELGALQASLNLRIKELDLVQQVNVNLTSTVDTLSLEVTRLRAANDELMAENAKLSMPKPWPWIVFIAGLCLSAFGGGLLLAGARSNE